MHSTKTKAHKMLVKQYGECLTMHHAQAQAMVANWKWEGLKNGVDFHVLTHVDNNPTIVVVYASQDAWSIEDDRLFELHEAVAMIARKRHVRVA
jgi:hypothetical protein